MATGNPSGAPSRRVHRRNQVRVTVHWHNRQEEAVTARLYDISAEGLFLVPDRLLADTASVGDPIWVVLHSEGKDHTITGTVRWRGFHPSHNVVGCGVKLDEPSLAIVKHLFPVVEEG